MHIPALWQMIIVVTIAIAAVIPVVKILHRLGYSGWWAVLAPISPLNIIGLWALAYAEWPRERPEVHARSTVRAQ